MEVTEPWIHVLRLSSSSSSLRAREVEEGVRGGVGRSDSGLEAGDEAEDFSSGGGVIRWLVYGMYAFGACFGRMVKRGKT
jgi:hypothetical protein